MLWKTCLLGPIIPLYVVVAGTGRPREDRRALPLLRVRRGPRGRLPSVRGRGDDPSPACLRGLRSTLHHLRAGRGGAAACPQAGRLQGAVRAGQAGVGSREGLQEPTDLSG